MFINQKGILIMAIPSYLWLKDDGGTDIKGSVDVRDREGSIEINGFSHNLSIPTDGMTGKITGTRKHSAVILQKEFDSSSPYLYKAVATGQTLKPSNQPNSNGIVSMMPVRKLNISICCWKA